MRLIAFDIGDKRTGFATGSLELGLVTPVGVLEVPCGAALVARMVDAIEEHGAERVILGLPLNMDGTEGPRAKLLRTFATDLAKRISCEIEWQDERLSSYAADQRMSRTGLTHQQKKARRDALAAASILQDYIDRVSGDG